MPKRLCFFPEQSSLGVGVTGKVFRTGLTAIAFLFIAGHAQARGPSAGDIEKDAYARYGDKYDIRQIDVLSEQTGQGGMSDGYNAWISVNGCKGNIMLSYDRAGIFKTSYDTLKCGSDG